MEITKEQKQKNLFRSICQIYDKSKNDLCVTVDGTKYTGVMLHLTDESFEEIREWAEE